MKISEIWGTIIIPILIGPLFIYLKSLYDNYSKRKDEHKLLLYNTKNDHFTNILNKFYWPLYIKLLCIYQLNFSIPLKNEYEYISDSEEDNQNSNEIDNNSMSSNDSNNSDIHININIDNNTSNIIGQINELPIKDIILDQETIILMKDNLNKLFDESLDILENNIYNLKFSKKLNTNLIQFIKYCKLRKIINNKYNIEYLGVKNNTNKLLSLIESELFKYQNEYNLLIEKGPFK